MKKADNFDLRKFITEGLFNSKNETTARILELEETVKKLDMIFENVIKYDLSPNTPNVNNLKKLKKQYMNSIFNTIRFLKGL
jgi:hypothetical protein